MEAYTQQVALEQLKDENKDKARLAQKLAELEVLCLSASAVLVVMLWDTFMCVHVGLALLSSTPVCWCSYARACSFASDCML